MMSGKKPMMQESLRTSLKIMSVVNGKDPMKQARRFLLKFTQGRFVQSQGRHFIKSSRVITKENRQGLSQGIRE